MLEVVSIVGLCVAVAALLWVVVYKKRRFCSLCDLCKNYSRTQSQKGVRVRFDLENSKVHFSSLTQPSHGAGVHDTSANFLPSHDHTALLNDSLTSPPSPAPLDTSMFALPSDNTLQFKVSPVSSSSSSSNTTADTVKHLHSSSDTLVDTSRTLVNSMQLDNASSLSVGREESYASPRSLRSHGTQTINFDSFDCSPIEVPKALQGANLRPRRTTYLNLSECPVPATPDSTTLPVFPDVCSRGCQTPTGFKEESGTVQTSPESDYDGYYTCEDDGEEGTTKITLHDKSQLVVESDASESVLDCADWMVI